MGLRRRRGERSLASLRLTFHGGPHLSRAVILDQIPFSFVSFPLDFDSVMRKGVAVFMYLVKDNHTKENCTTL